MTDQPPGHDYRVPVADEDKEVLQGIASMVNAAIPESYCFTLFLVPRAEGGTSFYISNAQRADMIRAMQEFIAKQANA